MLKTLWLKYLLIIKIAGSALVGITAIYNGAVWYNDYVRSSIHAEDFKAKQQDSLRISFHAIAKVERDYSALTEAVLCMSENVESLKSKVDTIAKHTYRIERTTAKSNIDALRWYDQQFSQKKTSIYNESSQYPQLSILLNLTSIK